MSRLVHRLLLASVLLVPALPRAAPPPDMERLATGPWIARARLAELPTTGAAWEAVRDDAERLVLDPDLADQNDPSNVRVFAKALVHARTGDPLMAAAVRYACLDIIGSERGASSLALGRELMAYVLAADLVGLPPEQDALFRDWLARVRDTPMSEGRTLRQTHERRPNGWGTYAGATRLAIAVYLDEPEEIAEVARIFRGWLGDRSAYADFRYGDLDWQADPRRPVGINPSGAQRAGHSIDGAIAEGLRRSGPFDWPPPHENYIYSTLQGALAQAVILERAGYDAFAWQDQALLRAFEWLHQQADFPAEGDDTWQPHLINHFYHRDFPAPIPSRPGKNIGYTDWTHAGWAPTD
ncbi:alginate lyase family protein [Marichromatium bheemlicum]|uniref:Alginate lyase domain-containing protein n=1 Tax=Marichromatium bheemlicum TaxID=365339 RepID=A0ABX1IAK6_9GAMM|nr:alginate lyase family protein [Marichromatium bheemlicum]NKN33896.1 hypothetical protein [Marichromatium bheemlicum]